MSNDKLTMNAEAQTLLGSMKKVIDDARDRLKANRDRILSTLKELRATHVVVSYSGSGDSGQVDQVEVFRDKVELKATNPTAILVSSSTWSQENSRWDETTEIRSIPLEEALEDFVCDWLQAEHGGWENNDGASGECKIDVRDGQFVLAHTSYYTESDYMESAI
jgi:hypothetical protein